MEQMEQIKVLEAMLFASAEPLTPAMIYERLGTEADLNVLLSDLKGTYTGRGVELVETGGAWALRTSAETAPYLTIEKDVDRKLSRAALETLAIVAYHQPITRAEIENIRGVATHKGTLDALMEMGWVKPGKRRETPGRPLTWVTTTAFLDHFQLESLMDLPGMDDLKAAGLLDRRPAIETVPDTRDLFDNPDEAAGDLLAGSSDEDQDEFDGYDQDDEA
jgi:segregation and condensation protein B